MAHTGRSNLSYKKFCEYLSKKSFEISAIYCLTDEDSKEIKLVESRSPRYFKTFFIYVPSRYRMLYSSQTIDETISIVMIEQLEKPFESHLERVRMVKDKLGSDVVSISKVIYVIASEEAYFSRIDKEVIRESCYDPIGDLESRAADVNISKVKWREKTIHAESLKNMEVDGQELRTVVPKRKKERVKLVFVDEKNVKIESLDDIIEKMDGTTSRIEDVDTFRRNNFRHRSAMTEMIQTEDNSVPFRLIERSFSIGILFLLFDVNTIFHATSNFETDLLESYNKLDTIEQKLLLDNEVKIQNLLTKLSQYLAALSKDYITNEENTRKQLLRLTAILTDSKKTKKSLKERKKPLRGNEKIETELDSIIESTQRTIHDIQSARLQQKELIQTKYSDAVTLLDNLAE